MTRLNLMDSPVPVVRYRALSVGGDTYTRTMPVTRQQDLPTHVERAARTFAADPWLVSLVCLTGRIVRGLWARELRRVA